MPQPQTGRPGNVARWGRQFLFGIRWGSAAGGICGAEDHGFQHPSALGDRCGQLPTLPGAMENHGNRRRVKWRIRCVFVYLLF